jgi:hypothetical protein
MIYLFALVIASGIAVWCYTYATFEPIGTELDGKFRVIDANLALIAYNVGALIVISVIKAVAR